MMDNKITNRSKVYQFTIEDEENMDWSTGMGPSVGCSQESFVIKYHGVK